VSAKCGKQEQQEKQHQQNWATPTKKKKKNNKTIRNQQTLGLSHVIACHNVDDKSTTHSGVKAKYLDLFLIF